jgi:acetyl esterase
MDEPMCVYFRKQTGAKIISIDYPKAPAYPYPAAVEAVYEIVKHYVDNAEQYCIDPKSIGIGGHSAGGNLATVICILAKEKGDFTVKYQVLDFPPCDLSIDAYDRPKPKGALSPKMVDMFNVCYFDSNTETARLPYVSPVFATKEQLSGLPPVLLITAGRDSLHNEAVHYLDLLKDAGVSVEHHDFADSVHGFTYYGKPDAKRGWNIMADFIKKHIGDGAYEK